MARGNLYQPVTVPVPDTNNPNQSFLKIMGNVRVTVKVAGTSNNAAIFQSRNPAEVTPMANPFTTSTGVVNIWAEYGEYDVTFTDLVTPSRFTDQTFGWSSAPAGDDSIPTLKLAHDAGIDPTSFTAALNAMLFKTGDLKLTLESLSADPEGWVRGIGQNVSRTGVYAPLFAKVGTRYGTGDGSTTFGLPDLRGRVMLGAGTGSSLSARSLGDTGGLEAVTLTIDQIPSHIHGFTGADEDFPPAASADLVPRLMRRIANWGPARVNGAVQPNGGGNGHTNMMPFAVAHWLIKL